MLTLVSHLQNRFLCHSHNLFCHCFIYLFVLTQIVMFKSIEKQTRTVPGPPVSNYSFVLFHIFFSFTFTFWATYSHITLHYTHTYVRVVKSLYLSIYSLIANFIRQTENERYRDTAKERTEING